MLSWAVDQARPQLDEEQRMSRQSLVPDAGPSSGLPGYPWLVLATMVATYLLIVLGGFTRVSGSGLGCGNDWPLCQGHLLPPLEFEPIVEWSHRFVTSIISFLIAGTAVVAWLGVRPGCAGYPGRNRRRP